MFRFFTLCAALLMLALVATVPAVAEAPDLAAEPVQAEPLQDLDLTAEPLMTPVEQPEDLDFGAFEDPERVNKLRVCDDHEEAQCPPGCFCLIIRNAINCYC